MLLDKLQFSVLRLKFERDVQFFCRGVYCIWIRAIFGKKWYGLSFAGVIQSEAPQLAKCYIMQRNAVFVGWF